MKRRGNYLVSSTFTRLVSILLTLALVITPFSSAYAFNHGSIQERDGVEIAKQLRQQILQKLSLEAKSQKLSERFGNLKNLGNGSISPSTQYQPNDKVRVIIKLEGSAVVEGLNQIGQMLNRTSANTLSKLEKNISSEQTNLLNSLKVQRINFTARNQFKYMLNAISGDVFYKDIQKIKKITGVEDVRIANEYYPDKTFSADPDMYFSAPLIGANSVWPSYDGEGTVVAIIDTGVNYFHPAFGGSGKETLNLGDNQDRSPVTGNGAGYTERIIGGYNWADGNNDIVDRTSSQHGVHVAGTAAGYDESAIIDGKPFRGVAPKAKILAEKVFSNDPDRESTTADELIAAIEHAVLNGADVINMSLGSPAGAVVADDPEILAVENATNAGVVVTISAGNSSYSSAWLPFASNSDYAMVGSPSISPSSISVAASVNEKALFEAFTLSEPVSSETEGIYNLKDVPMMAAGALPQPSTLVGKEYDLVYAGLGAASDFEEIDVQGKVALIKRGQFTFSSKVQNAADNGAVAAIIFNRDDADGYVSMGGFTGNEGIPAAFILGEHGRTIKEALDSGTPLKVTFNDQPVVGDLAKDTMTDFSSWGPEPSLNFKPTLTAPGGNIYSSVRYNEYEGASGTSMAAPHVTGASAVVIQSFRERYPDFDYTPNDIRTALSNTAKVLMDPNASNENTPYSVRLQGAGRIQLDKAVSTDVFITGDNGEAGVALKDFDAQSITFTLTAKNLADTDYTYQLRGDAYQDETFTGGDGLEYNSLSLKPIEGAIVTFENESVTVPAKGEVSFDVTLTLPEGFKKDQFVDGWIYLTADETQNAPDLVVPYFGYYGDWNTPPVIDDHWSKEDTSYYWISGLYDWYEGFPLGVTFDELYKDGYAAFSPNGDGIQEAVLPVYSLLRNAKSFEINILDSNMKKIRTLTKENDLRKNTYESSTDELFTSFNEWDGTVNGNLVADGQYYVQTVVQAYGVDAGESQEYLYPVKVDTVKPTVSVQLVSNGNGKELQIIGNDESGIFAYDYTIYDSNGNLIDSGFVGTDETENGYTAIQSLTELTDVAYAEVYALDYAGNYTFAKTDMLPFVFYGASVDKGQASVMLSWDVTQEVSDIEITLDGNIPFRIADEEDLSWHHGYELPLTYGDHTIMIKAIGLTDSGSEQVLAMVQQDVKGINALSLNVDDTLTVSYDDPVAQIDYTVLSDRVKSVVISVYGKGESLETQEIDTGISSEYTYEFNAEETQTTLTLSAFDDSKSLLGEQTVVVNMIKTFDVLFTSPIYSVEDDVYLPIEFKVSKDVDSVIFNVYNEEDISVTDSVYFTVTDSVYNYDLDISNFFEGTYTLTLDAYDSEGGFLDRDEAALYLYPTGVLSYPQVQDYDRTNQDTYLIKWGYDNPDSVTQDVYRLSLTINGQLIGNPPVEDTSYTVDMTPYKDGQELDVQLVAEDSGGNVVGRLFYVVVKDLAAPAWYFDSPWYYDIFNGRNATGEVSAYTFDTDLDPDSVTLYVPGMDEAISVDVFDYFGIAYLVEEQVNFTEEGQQNIELHYKDLAGNSGYYHRKVFVDLTSPSIQLDSPNITLTQTSDEQGNLVYEGTMNTYSSTISLAGQVSETISSFDFWVNDNQLLASIPSKGLDSGFTLDQRQFKTSLNLNNGLNEIVLKAVDGAGNETTVNLKVTKLTSSGGSNDEGSSGGISTPSTGQTTTTETGQGTVTVKTNENGKKSAEVKVDGKKIASQLTDDSKKTVEVDVSTLSTDDVGEINVSIDIETVDKMINSGKGLTIVGDGFAIEISSENLNSLRGDNGLNLKVNVESPEDKSNVRIQSMNQSNIVSKIFSINGDGTLTEPITFSIKLNEAADPRKVGVYLETDGSWKYVSGIVNWDNTAVKVTTSQFGRFAAIEHTIHFNDIEGHWAQDKIEVLAAQHVIKGLTANSFGPEDKLTRAQFVTMLVRLLNLDTSEAEVGDYRDVSSDDWFAPYVAAATKAGIVKGFDGKFAPNALISRQDMVVMLMRALRQSLPDRLQYSAGNTTFNDQDMISSYAQEDVSLALANGLVTGMNDAQFAPKLSATRGQAATILYRLFFE